MIEKDRGTEDRGVIDKAIRQDSKGWSDENSFHVTSQDDTIQFEWEYLELMQEDLEHYYYDLDVPGKRRSVRVFNARNVYFIPGQTSTGNTGEFLINYLTVLRDVYKKKYLFIRNPKQKNGTPAYNGVKNESDDVIKPYINSPGETIARIGPKRAWRGTKKGFTNCSTAILEAISSFFGDGYGTVNNIPIQDIEFEPFIKIFQGKQWVRIFEEYPLFGKVIHDITDAKRGDILSTGNHRLLITGKPKIQEIESKTKPNKIIKRIYIPVIEAAPPTNSVAIKTRILKPYLKNARTFKVGRFYDHSEKPI